MSRVILVTGPTPKVKSTRFPELGYRLDSPRNWRFVDTSTDNSVGPSYPTRESLLENLTAYAKESWGLS